MTGRGLWSVGGVRPSSVHCLCTHHGFESRTLRHFRVRSVVAWHACFASRRAGFDPRRIHQSREHGQTVRHLTRAHPVPSPLRGGHRSTMPSYSSILRNGGSQPGNRGFESLHLYHHAARTSLDGAPDCKSGVAMQQGSIPWGGTNLGVGQRLATCLGSRPTQVRILSPRPMRLSSSGRTGRRHHPDTGSNPVSLSNPSPSTLSGIAATLRKWCFCPFDSDLGYQLHGPSGSLQCGALGGS